MQYQVRRDFELARYTIQDDKFEYLSEKVCNFYCCEENWPHKIVAKLKQDKKGLLCA